MSNANPASEPDRGYLSDESRHRFTLVAGVLGVVFFIAQFALPMLVMFLIMMPMMIGHAFKDIDLDQAAVLHDELWVLERTIKTNWRKPESSNTTLALAHVRLADLADSGPAPALEGISADSDPALLAVGDRLWLIGSDTVGYYANGSLVRLPGVKRPERSSRPFAYEGQPAVISLGSPATLAALHVDGGRAAWTARDLPLNLPSESGGLRTLQAIEGGGSLYLFAQLCTESPDHCSIVYRELNGEKWLRLADDLCSCASWTAISLMSRPAVFLSEEGKGDGTRLATITVSATGPRREEIRAEGGSRWARWRAFASDSGLILLSTQMPGSLRILAVSDGRVTRSSSRPGTFPFPENMMLLMIVPQVLPIVLSIVLAFLLTLQMRRHRVQEYVVGTDRRRFASLWQRALAQLVDVVPFVAGFFIPAASMWRMFSNPEQFVESGAFPFAFFGLFAAAIVWALLVLVAFSFLEGRFGKTPGKWLLRIRVLGTDLRPCGFGRAFLRNLLTFADGFFSFLVGALLVALTENWQRLGDLAARTVVVADERPA